MESFLRYILKYAVLLIIGAGVSWYFYHFKRKAIFGRFIGGMIIALLGAIIFDLIFTLQFMKTAMVFLTTETHVHIPAAFLGAFIALFILNRINHDQDRLD